MNKNIYRVASFVTAIILTIGAYTPGRATSQTALMPSQTINIAHFFKPPSSMDAATAVKNFSTIVLTNGDHTYRAALAANGFASSIPEYFRADGIQNPGSCTATPLNNQVAYKVGDFCSISKNHPDWFLLDKYGKRITVTSGGSYYRMDPGNAGWRAFFVTRVVENQKQYGWSALFLDNVEGGLGKFYGPKPVKYPDNASYQKAVSGFLSYLDVNYSQKYGRPIMGNLVASADDTIWTTYLQYLDGAMKERFAVGWSETAYLSSTKWLSDLQQVEKAQASGKYVILISPGYKSDTKRQTFAFASYLLSNKGKAAFRYSTDDAYKEVWLYTNYKVKLGNALNARYLKGSIWRRDFQYGYVTVDPVNHVGVIKVTTTTTTNSTTLSQPDANLATPITTPTTVPTIQATATTVVLPTETAVVAPTETPVTVSENTVYNDNNTVFAYAGSWQDVTASQAVEGSFKLTQQVDSSITLPFTGTAFTVIYKTGSLFGNMDVYVDGQLIGTINQKTDSQQFQQKWSYSDLTEGPHELKLIFTGPADTRASLDAVTLP